MTNRYQQPMRSPFSRLYLDLSNHLEDALPEIRFIDQYTGQDQNDLRPSLAYPALLIDFENTNYSDMGGLGQLADVTVTIRLFVDNYTTATTKAPEKAKNQALYNYELEQRVVKQIHGWMPDEGYAQPLIRQSAQSDNRNDIGLRIRTLTFTTQWEEVFI